jgi:ferredoxin
MTTRIINREDLIKLLDSLLKDFQVIGPKEIANKGIFYEQISHAGDLYLGGGFAIEPIKKFFLEPSECLAKSAFVGGKNVTEDLPLPDKKRILIGLRPCEARGLVLLDKVFCADYKDKSFINNRERSVLVGLACASPDETCFCTSMGGSPVESRGMDALLFATEGSPGGDTEDGFVVEVCTDKGEKIFGSAGQELDLSKQKSLEAYKQKRKDLIKKKLTPPDDLTPSFESAYWTQVAFPCLSCGICTYLCPTCHCFDLIDEERKKLRCYDGCAFCDFTLEASGVNPRPTKRERYRQRVFHKFDYFKKNFGENLCIGCGRCIRFCPVKIDIAEAAKNAPLKTKP